MNAPTRAGLALVSSILFCAGIAQAQEGARIVFDENAPKRYSEAVQPIYEEIDSLRGKLNDDSLSMSDAAKIIEQQSALRRKADSLWNSTQAEIDKSYRDARDAIVNYNAGNRQLEFESAITGSIADGLNNVSKYPTKDAFDSNKATMAKAWDQNYGSRLKPFGEDFAKMKDDFFARYKEKYGVDLNEAGYSQIGTINPYTGEVYYKYYGPDGNLIAGQWKNDAEGYEKWKQDADTYRRRQRDMQEQLQKETSELNQFDGQFQSSRSTGQSNLRSLERSVTKVNFAGGWRGGDNTGNNNRVSLSLNLDGTLTYAWSRSRASYSGRGRWTQTGKRVTARTNDGKYQLRSRIADDNRMEFNVVEDGSPPFQVFLNR